MRVRHLQSARLTAQLLDSSNGSLHHLRIRTRVAEGHGAPVRGDRMTPVGGDVTVGDEWPPFTIAAESERLQLPNDLERKRIVKFKDIHVVAANSCVAEGAIGRASAHYTINVVAAPPREIPRGRVLIRRPVEIRAAAQHVDRSVWKVNFVCEFF